MDDYERSPDGKVIYLRPRRKTGNEALVKPARTQPHSILKRLLSWFGFEFKNEPRVLTLEMPTETFRRIQELSRRTETDIAGTCRVAFAVLELCLNERDSGHEVLIRDPKNGNESRVILPPDVKAP